MGGDASEGGGEGRDYPSEVLQQVDRLEGRKEVQRSGSALQSLLLKLLETCGHRDPKFYELGN